MNPSTKQIFVTWTGILPTWTGSMSRGLLALPGLTVSSEVVKRDPGGYRLSSKVRPVCEYSSDTGFCLGGLWNRGGIWNQEDDRAPGTRMERPWLSESAIEKLEILFCVYLQTLVLYTIFIPSLWWNKSAPRLACCLAEQLTLSHHLFAHAQTTSALVDMEGPPQSRNHLSPPHLARFAASRAVGKQLIMNHYQLALTVICKWGSFCKTHMTLSQRHFLLFLSDPSPIIALCVDPQLSVNRTIYDVVSDSVHNAVPTC